MKSKGIILIIVGILIATASWAIYQVINQFAKDMLAKVGVVNFYYQNIIVIAFVVVVLLVTGMLGQKTIKKMLRL